MHLVGIGGIGMSGLALMLSDLGIPVSGCDRAPSRALDLLRRRGIPVVDGHSEGHLEGVSRVVYSSAVSARHPELVEALRRGIPCQRRADFLGRLVRDLRVLAVAGTHGKTTTTAMLSVILYRAGLDPWWMVGGVPRDLPCHGHAGRGDLAVVEADEYDASFLTLRPYVSVVTNIEPEHLDFYGSYEQVVRAFGRFVTNSHLAVICLEDQGAAGLAASTGRAKALTYGIGRGDWRASAIGQWSGGARFVAEGPGAEKVQVRLRLWGHHNVLNGLAALAAASLVEVDAHLSAEYLSEFTGVERRLQLIGNWKGIPVYDDYAHHPSEIRATLEAVRSMLPGRRLTVVFQPHTYSRTRAMLEQFAGELGKFDSVLIVEVYPARDEAVEPISGSELAARIPGARFVKDLAEAKEELEAMRPRTDVVLTVGAGDIWKLGWELVHGH